MITGISLALAVLGLAVSLYFGAEARRAIRRVRKYDWNEIDSGVKYLAGKIERDYAPDLIVCSSGGSVGIVANLYLTYTERFIPLYIGISKNKNKQFTSEPIFSAVYETSRWTTHLPENLAATKAKHVLVLEDVVLSGESMKQIIKVLVDSGIPRNNIRTAALFTTEIAITDGNAPDYFWYRLPDTHFYLPWGKSTGKGY